MRIFLGGVAAGEGGGGILEYDLAIAAVVAAIGTAVYLLGRVQILMHEHAWLTPLRDAIRVQEGVIFAYELLSMDVLAGIGAELAMLDEMEDE